MSNASNPAALDAPIQTVNASSLQSPLGHYSHVASHGGFAFISGQLPVDAEGTPLVDRPFTDQVKRVLHNIDACLESVDLTRGDLMFVTVYVTDISLWAEFDRIYEGWIADHRPARAVAGVKELHFGAAVEVHAVAMTR
jgi:2-iminobutanoate/2-iminopropanoate deaminase